MGRIDEMWMTCRASLTAAVLDVRRMGMRCGRAPQIAILPMRLSLTHKTVSDRLSLLLSSPSARFRRCALSLLLLYTGPQQTNADRRAHPSIIPSPKKTRGGAFTGRSRPAFHLNRRPLQDGTGSLPSSYHFGIGNFFGVGQSFILCIHGALSTNSSCARGTGGWHTQVGSNSSLIFKNQR